MASTRETDAKHFKQIPVLRPRHEVVRDLIDVGVKFSLREMDEQKDVLYKALDEWKNAGRQEILSELRTLISLLDTHTQEHAGVYGNDVLYKIVQAYKAKYSV